MRIDNFNDLKESQKQECRYFYCYYVNYGVGGVVHEYKEVSLLVASAFCNTPTNARDGFITTDYVQAQLWANN
jgi:hypothetical protein